MRWEPQAGFLLLDSHLLRLERSARFLDFRFDDRSARIKLEAAIENTARVPMKLRLALSASGNVEVDAMPMGADPLPDCALVRFADVSVDKTEFALLHKTTDRSLYRRQLDARPDCYDVLLWNGGGFITELTRFNVLAHTGGRWITPPTEHGLLPGTLRQELLRSRLVAEVGLKKHDARNAQALAAINSVRGFLKLKPLGSDAWLLEPVATPESGSDPLFGPLINCMRQVMRWPGVCTSSAGMQESIG